jgi:hypothetical protein
MRGTHACAADGSGFGACEGEVVPQPENCITPEDEACNGGGESDTAACGPFGHVWSKTFGDKNLQTGSDIAIDPTTGDFVIVGQFSGIVDFGGGPMASTGGSDIFVAKLGPLGEFRWSKRFGDASSQEANAVVIDQAGMIYVGGEMSGSVDFGDGVVVTSVGSDDAFVAKFDPDGNVQWEKLLGDTSTQEVARMAVTKAGQIVVGGNFSGSIDFGNGPIAAAGSQDAFVMKLDSSGFVGASRAFGGPDFDDLTAIDVDAMDNIAVTGTFSGAMTVGPNMVLTSAGSNDVFVAKLSPVAAVMWAKNWGDATSQEATDVHFAPNGDVLLAGTLTGSINFGGVDLSAPPDATHLYLARLDGSGAHVWSTVFGGPLSTGFAARIAIDEVKSHILVAGFFDDTVDFGGGPFVSSGDYDAFVARLLPDGKHVASRSFGGLKSDGVFAIDLLPTGDPIIAGVHLGTFDLGGGPLEVTGTELDPNVFVARLLP